MKNNAKREDKIFDIILEESFDKYANYVATQDAECKMSEEEIKAMEDREKTICKNLMKDISQDKKVHISVKKVCVLVAVLLLGIIVVSFGVSAVNIWIQRTNVSVDGTDINIDTKKLDFNGYNDINEFVAKDIIIIPNWLPEGMELNKVNDFSDSVNLFYKKDDKFVTITTIHAFDTINSKIATENNKVSMRESNILGMKCKIITMTSEIGLTAHSVFWNSNSSSYELMTNVSEEDLDKILENLIYFEE